MEENPLLYAGGLLLKKLKYFKVQKYVKHF